MDCSRLSYVHGTKMAGFMENMERPVLELLTKHAQQDLIVE
jgi:hypothetical protein